MRASNQPTEQDTRYHLNSPLLFGVLKAIDPESRADILDLAPATPELLNYFSSYHCRLCLPGCRDALLKLHVEEDQDELTLSHIFNSLMPLPDRDSKPLDLILLWDLPNYLDKQVLAALIAHYTSCIDSHTVLHIYIHTHQTMPEKPADYRLDRDNKILVESSTAWDAVSPMYYQELLHKVVKPFRVERGVLLANGLQEYILRIKT
jgi:hypothetical protein